MFSVCLVVEVPGPLTLHNNAKIYCTSHLSVGRGITGSLVQAIRFLVPSLHTSTWHCPSGGVSLEKHNLIFMKKLEIQLSSLVYLLFFC